MTRPIDADKLIAALKRKRRAYTDGNNATWRDAFDAAIAIVERLARSKK
jgi:hypothetical protein